MDCPIHSTRTTRAWGAAWAWVCGGGFGSQAPYIEQPLIPHPGLQSDRPSAGQGVGRESRQTRPVWMEVTKPSTPPPSPPPGYQTPISHAVRVALTYNPTTDRFEVDVHF